MFQQPVIQQHLGHLCGLARAGRRGDNDPAVFANTRENRLLYLVNRQSVRHAQRYSLKILQNRNFAIGQPGYPLGSETPGRAWSFQPAVSTRENPSAKATALSMAWALLTVSWYSPSGVESL